VRVGALRIAVVCVTALAALPVVVSAASNASAATVKSCAPAQLSLARGARHGTAGTAYIAIIFTNKGESCALWGVPAIQPVTGPLRKAVGPGAHSLSMGQMPLRHVLRKGKSVSVAIGVVDTGNYPSSSCVARTATGVVVSLSPFIHPTYLRLPIKVCTRRWSVTTRLLAPGTTGA